MDTNLSRQRWIQLGLGLVAMMAISSPQYVWTLFTKPMQGTTGASLPAIQVTITILIGLIRLVFRHRDVVIAVQVPERFGDGVRIMRVCHGDG